MVNNNVKYFEVWLQESDSPGGLYDYDVCIKGLRTPTMEEAEEFLTADREANPKHILHVKNVFAITREEAEDSFDLTNEAEWPVFGA